MKIKVQSLINDTKYFFVKLFSEKKNILKQIKFRFRKVKAKLFIKNSVKFYIYNKCRNKTSITFIVNLYERLGDIIATEPIARHLKSKYPDCKIIWTIRKQYLSLIQYNPFIDEVIIVSSLQQVDSITKKEESRGVIIIDCLFHRRRDDGQPPPSHFHVNTSNPLINYSNYFLYGGLLECFCLSSGLPRLKDKPKLWINESKSIKVLKIRERASNRPIITIHCTSSQATRNYSTQGWQVITKELISKGYCVIELGTESCILYPSEHFIDSTIENLSISESIEILKSSDFFIGIDSSMAHAANAANIPSIILLGSLPNFVEYTPYSNKSNNRVELRNFRGPAFAIKPDSVLKAFCYLSTRIKLKKMNTSKL